MAFVHLVKRSDLDGQPFRAILCLNDTLLAAHSFEASKSDQDYWRGKLSSLREPPKETRLILNTRGQRRNLYLDDATWHAAVAIGDGNASEGVRRAVHAKFKQAQRK